MSPTHDLEQSGRISGDEPQATITIGSRTSLTAPASLIEGIVTIINQHLTSDREYGWIPISSGSTDDHVVWTMVSRSTEITVQWPVGYEAFEAPNKWVDELIENPVTQVEQDSE